MNLEVYDRRLGEEAGIDNVTILANPDEQLVLILVRKVKTSNFEGFETSFILI